MIILSYIIIVIIAIIFIAIIIILQQALADRRRTNPVDPVISHHTFQERQPAAVPELPCDQPHQSPKKSHAEDHTEQIEAMSEDHR